MQGGDNRATQHEVRKAEGGRWITENVGARMHVSILIPYERAGPCGAVGAGGSEGCRGRSRLQTDVKRATSGVKARSPRTRREAEASRRGRHLTPPRQGTKYRPISTLA